MDTNRNKVRKFLGHFLTIEALAIKYVLANLDIFLGQTISIRLPLLSFRMEFSIIDHCAQARFLSSNSVNLSSQWRHPMVYVVQ